MSDDWAVTVAVFCCYLFVDLSNADVMQPDLDPLDPSLDLMDTIDPDTLQFGGTFISIRN